MKSDNKIELGVNIDHVATVRQARGTSYPSLIDAAHAVLHAGADAITIHLREDRRHIQDQDVYDIREVCHKRLNLEIAATDGMTAIAIDVKPDDVCIVPEKREELTTEGGLDVIKQYDRIKACVDRLMEQGIRPSLFIEPNIVHIEKTIEMGAPVIELHTGHYADTIDEIQQRELKKIQQVTQFAHEAGIRVNAGHGLNYQNTHDIAVIKNIRELNIGHAIVSRALFVGIENATKQMREIMNNACKV